MATIFGKILRKIRIDQDELLKDMAEKLDITSAYLSAIENGKRPIPANLVNIIKNKYKLEESIVSELMAAEDTIRTSVSFNLSGIDDEKRQMVISLARSFDDISDEKLAEIRKILEHKEV
ncbi:helix-turn-helix domain-containing protein [Veillonella montpellierensis]|uniref:helix-turn-helix domain-containing protein n=1 Tax=Veillonella montpellierensis TaxID=187328 RepID=UPI0023F8B76F|nr:helix-turn-helix transcriptional regulator [Veillonella montpellierensis]